MSKEQTNKNIEVCQTVPAGIGNSGTIPATVINAKYKYDFVVNNYTETEVCQLKEHLPLLCKKALVGKEIGELGTPHLQGYISLKRKERITGLHKVAGLARASFREVRNEEALINYCAKDGEIIIKFGFPHEYKKITYDMLRSDQQVIADIFDTPEDPLWGRKIYWFWEEAGNWGKSVLATYLIDQKGAVEVSGANNDILFGVSTCITENKGKCPPIIIFDLPRSVERVSYAAIEKVKNGKFFSPKYESSMVRFDRPHIIIFANRPPELEMLSKDRWVIQELGKDEKNEWCLDDIINGGEDAAAPTL